MIDIFEQSRLQLYDTLETPPIEIKSYEVLKYVKISIGSTVNVRDMFILRPGNIMKIRWQYDDDELVCLGMMIDGVEYPVYWKIDKIKKWISKNCKEI